MTISRAELFICDRAEELFHFKKEEIYAKHWQPRSDLTETLTASNASRLPLNILGRMVPSEGKLCNLHTLFAVMPMHHSEGICLLTAQMR